MPRKRKARQFPPPPPLAWERDDEPFQLPTGAVAWKIRGNTGKPGRPALVWSMRGIVVESVSNG